ncbi:MAG: hydrogenase iron-sulfur subunit [Chloroflexi bacterium]|nr:hydrogenase iron-sulfur subunit [Chloroflexota bacterium]MBU1750758.1 hydrogenase iron-sulfur subunit [Chloroflexota bacterium]MBU1878082.1 hydrogenase iron-sulfur subunit [Chloroflexota bacterium]
MATTKPFEPKIVGFLCNWCSYAGADTAGLGRLKYPDNLRIVRVRCSGRVAPDLVLRTFQEGADGVMVLGCHIGDCHYVNGNHRTAKRIPMLRKLLEVFGIEPDRLRLEWVSASEGQRFAQVVTDFTETIRRLGPLELHPTLSTTPTTGATSQIKESAVHA